MQSKIFFRRSIIERCDNVQLFVIHFISISWRTVSHYSSVCLQHHSLVITRVISCNAAYSLTSTAASCSAAF